MFLKIFSNSCLLASRVCCPQYWILPICQPSALKPSSMQPSVLQPSGFQAPAPTCIMGVVHCASNFMCNLVFKRNFTLKWHFNTSCFAPCSYVRTERSNEIWVFSSFCTPIELFFKKSWASRSCSAHNIFISCHNPVSRTRTTFLAVRSLLLSLLCAHWYSLIDSFFSLVRCYPEMTSSL